MTGGAAGAGEPESAARCRIAFAHYSGKSGVGEYARCLALALAVRSRRPSAEFLFIGSKDTVRFNDDDFPRADFDGSTSRREGLTTLLRIMDRFAPGVVLFDNLGSRVTYAATRSFGTRIVAQVTLPGTVARVTSARALARVDEVWFTQRRFDGGHARLGLWLRAKAAACGVALRTHDLIAVDPPEDRLAAARGRLGIGPEPYVLFSAGGGGWTQDGVPAPERFLCAAARFSGATGAAAVVVAGPLYRGDGVAGGVRVLRSVGLEEMASLIHHATLVVSSGGGSSLQALSRRKPCVLAAVGGSDQPERIARLGAAGAICPAALHEDAIAEAATVLWRSPERRAALVACVAALDYRNGVREGAERLVALAEGPALRRKGSPLLGGPSA